MSVFWFFWLCGLAAGFIAGRMGRRAWVWVIYGCLTGPVGLFHILMLAAGQIEQEKAAAREILASAVQATAPVLADGLSAAIVADVENAPGAFSRHGLVVQRILAGLDGRPAYIEGLAWPNNEVRCLRLDRIAALADVNTGKPVSDLEEWALTLVGTAGQAATP